MLVFINHQMTRGEKLLQSRGRMSHFLVVEVELHPTWLNGVSGLIVYVEDSIDLKVHNSDTIMLDENLLLSDVQLSITPH